MNLFSENSSPEYPELMQHAAVAWQGAGGVRVRRRCCQSDDDRRARVPATFWGPTLSAAAATATRVHVMLWLVQRRLQLRRPGRRWTPQHSPAAEHNNLQDDRGKCHRPGFQEYW